MSILYISLIKAPWFLSGLLNELVFSRWNTESNFILSYRWPQTLLLIHLSESGHILLLSSQPQVLFNLGFPGGSDSKESVCSVGDPGSIPGSGGSPGEGNGNPLQYSEATQQQQQQQPVLLPGKSHGRRSLAGYSPWGDSSRTRLRGFLHFTVESPGSPVAQMVKKPPAMLETWVRSLGWEEPLEEGLATHSSYSCLENPRGQDSLRGYGLQVRKELDTTEQLSTLALLNYLRSSSQFKARSFPQIGPNFGPGNW